MDISELIGETTDFEMEWKGKKVKFSAQTASLTPNFLNHVKDQADYAKAVVDVVRSWSLTDGKKPWPLTEEYVGKLPHDFLDTLLARICESWSGEKKSETPSQSGSAATA